MFHHLAGADGLYPHLAGLKVGDDGLRALLGLDFGLFAVDAGELDVEGNGAGTFLAKGGAYDPVSLWREGLDLFLALADEAEGDGLYASRATGAAHTPPQALADIEADETVDDAARLLRVYAGHVDLPGVGDGVGHRAGCDLIVLDAKKLLALAGGGQDLVEVPCDGLPSRSGSGAR